MTETFVAHVNGSHVCYRTSTGIDRAFIGCTHATPREAIDHTTREEDTPDARIPADRLRPEVVNHPEGIRQSLTETSGHPSPAAGPRRPAPAGTFPPGPVGAPSPERVP